jgi:hypothetical protein
MSDSVQSIYKHCRLRDAETGERNEKAFLEQHDDIGRARNVSDLSDASWIGIIVELGEYCEFERDYEGYVSVFIHRRSGLWPTISKSMRFSL